MIPLILLYLDTRWPHWITRPVIRAYAAWDKRKLRRLAARPPRFRLMTADRPDSAGTEWVRYISDYKIPISTPAEAVSRLTEAERLHPDYLWWIEPA